MLRTILSRNQIANNSLKKIVRPNNVTRCLSTKEDKSHLRLCSVISTVLRRKLHHRALTLAGRNTWASQWSIQIRKYASYPDHIKVNLPALSPTMESGSIVKWEKKEGDKLAEGDLLCEIETDKATMGFETPEEGYLAKILIQAGAKGVPVGKLLCIIVQNEGDVAAFKDFKDDAPAGAPAKAAAPAPAAPAGAPSPAAAPAPAPAAAAAAPQGGRVLASPMAKRLAEVKQLRLGGTGSGLYGSLKSGDLAGAAAAGPATAGAPAAPAPAPGATYVDVPLSGMRTTIAKRLTMSKQTIPHYQLSVVVNVEKTIAMRKAVNAKLEKAGIKLSMNDFIIKAVAAAAKKVPAVNSYWMETYIRQFTNVDVSVAVATPTGLITPIIFNADSNGIVHISKKMKELAGKAKEGKLSPNEYQGGTITVSNLGMFGITSFNAIINPPQSVIVGFGGLQDLAIPDKKSDSGFRAAKFMTITASGDHRVTDGVVGAAFVQALRDNLEDPANMIL